MTSLRKMGARFGIALLGAGTLLAAAPAAAQMPNGGLSDRPDDALSRNLRLLAANPRSLSALMGAGKAALDLGDPQAALTFFARGEEVAPRDGRIKMWIGMALVQMQQPRSALKFFGEATTLGVAEPEVAKERGLAHDLSGNPRAAQRDYRAALQRGRDDETTRRLALSLAISGEREPALQLLEAQLLARDRAAERARAMILGLTGDGAGAARAVRAAMPGPQADAMTPFLTRLASLNPAERALAVHLGVFPGDGRTGPPPTTYASNSYARPSPAASTPVTDAGKPDSSLPALGRRSTSAPATTSRRGSDVAPPVRRGNPEAQAAAPAEKPKAEKPKPTQIASIESAIRRRTPTAAEPEINWARGGFSTRRRAANAEPKRREPEAKPAETASKPETSTASAGTAPTIVPVDTAPKPVVSEPIAQPPVSQPVQTAGASDQPPAAQPPAAAPAQTAATDQPTATAPLQNPPLPATPGFTTIAAVDLAPSTATPAEEPKVSVSPPPAPATSALASRLADLSAAIESLPDVVDKPAAKPAVSSAPSKSKPQQGAAAVTGAGAKAKSPTAPAEPSRSWVQIAVGAEKGSLPREFARLKAKAPKLLGARTAWTAPLGATNRLLVGPFPSHKEAQGFVNQLKGSEIGAFAWDSGAGQKIEKLPAK